MISDGAFIHAEVGLHLLLPCISEKFDGKCEFNMTDTEFTGIVKLKDNTDIVRVISSKDSGLIICDTSINNENKQKIVVLTNDENENDKQIRSLIGTLYS